MKHTLANLLLSLNILLKCSKLIVLLSLCLSKIKIKTNTLFILVSIAPAHDFVASDSDLAFIKVMDTQCPVASKLQLKIGAQVCYSY